MILVAQTYLLAEVVGRVFINGDTLDDVLPLLAVMLLLVANPRRGFGRGRTARRNGQRVT